MRVGIGIRDGAETICLMIATWMLGSTAVPIDFRASSAERTLLASEFDLGVIIEDRQMSEAGYRSVLVDSRWTDTIGCHKGSPISPNDDL
jgi:hypothetical protein